MEWGENIYIDTCLSFGLHSAPRLFNVLADLLSWSAQQCGVSFIVHYLDDFLTTGPPDSTTFGNNLHTVKLFFADLGIPLSLEKVEGPSTTICFLGILLLDTVHMEIRLPTNKLQWIKDTLSKLLGKKKATKRFYFFGWSTTTCKRWCDLEGHLACTQLQLK